MRRPRCHSNYIRAEPGTNNGRILSSATLPSLTSHHRYHRLARSSPYDRTRRSRFAPRQTVRHRHPTPPLRDPRPAPPPAPPPARRGTSSPDRDPARPSPAASSGGVLSGDRSGGCVRARCDLCERGLGVAPFANASRASVAPTGRVHSVHLHGALEPLVREPHLVRHAHVDEQRASHPRQARRQLEVVRAGQHRGPRRKDLAQAAHELGADALAAEHDRRARANAVRRVRQRAARFVGHLSDGLRGKRAVGAAADGGGSGRASGRSARNGRTGWVGRQPPRANARHTVPTSPPQGSRGLGLAAEGLTQGSDVASRPPARRAPPRRWRRWSTRKSSRPRRPRSARARRARTRTRWRCARRGSARCAGRG